jgi:hypothetical protein
LQRDLGLAVKVHGDYLPCQYVLRLWVDSEKLYGELEGDHWLVGAKGDNRFKFFEAGFEKHDEKPGTLRTRRNAHLTADSDLVERIKRLRAGDLAVILDCAAADEDADADSDSRADSDGGG